MHYTLWLALLPHFVQRLSLQAATANFEGVKLAAQAKSKEDHGKCPRCNVTVSATAHKQNQCKKKSKIVECCNAKVRKDAEHGDGCGKACRTDVAPVYRPGCCGPWPGHEKVEDEDED